METKKCREGYVKPRTKQFHHRYEDGKLEWIEYEYQPLTQLLPQMISQELTRLKVKPKDVRDICIAIGGDHGIGAFRLSFKVIVILTSGVMHEKLCDGAGWVNDKDTLEVLEE